MWSLILVTFGGFVLPQRHCAKGNSTSPQLSSRTRYRPLIRPRWPQIGARGQVPLSGGGRDGRRYGEARAILRVTGGLFRVQLGGVFAACHDPIAGSTLLAPDSLDPQTLDPQTLDPHGLDATGDFGAARQFVCCSLLRITAPCSPQFLAVLLGNAYRTTRTVAARCRGRIFRAEPVVDFSPDHVHFVDGLGAWAGHPNGSCRRDIVSGFRR